MLHHDLAAGRREGVAEILAQPIAISRRHVREHRHSRELERLAGELGDESALEGIGEAHPEDAVADLGDLGIGGRRRDHGDARCLTHRTGLERASGGHLTQHRHHLVAADEFFDNGHRLTGRRSVVFVQQLKLFAQHAAGLVDLLNGQDRAFMGGHTKGGLRAGEGAELAHLNGVGSSGSSSAAL